MYVLDTNTLIYFFKGKGAVAERLLREAPKDIAIPAVVIYELQTGIAKSSSQKKRTEQLSALMNTVKILPFSTKEAQASATIRALLEKKGRPIGPYDVLIAGTAVAHQGTLVSHNLSEFKRIKNLKTQDWF